VRKKKSERHIERKNEREREREGVCDCDSKAKIMTRLDTEENEGSLSEHKN